MNKNIYTVVALSAVFACTSCNDDFLQDKKNYDNVNADIYDDYEGANGRVNDLYSWCLPNPNSDASYFNNATGTNDEQSKSTEEYAGFSVFVDPENEMDALNGTIVPDYFRNQSNNIQASVYGRIRNINDVIEGIEAGSLSDDKKDELVAQAYFFRAWCYYQLVKWYGGVPLVSTVQEPTESSFTPRSSARECIEFIISDLDVAAQKLASKNWESSNYGRITASAALALKQRVLLLWCSPILNRTNDQSRWTAAYETMKTDMETIRANHQLYTTGSNVNGSDFAGLFSQYTSKEAIFVTLANTVNTGDGQKNNMWEAAIRPKNTTGKGGKTPSSMLINLFPMKDGKLPATLTDNYTNLEKSEIDYDPTYPFIDRDPRFYRTFAFPGFRWAYSGDPTTADVNNPSYDNGTNYELWNYVWYVDKSDAGNVESGNSYGADNLLTSKCGVYIRKRSDDLDVNSSPLYAFDPSASNGGFCYSAAPYIEIRYAECLLNLAEAACGAGHLDEATAQLQKVRERAGYTAANNYGLPTSVSTNQASCMSAILYERQIELAYEGKRFDDARRWLLYDGGAEMSTIEGCPDTWKLTGWGGNTCTWLGVKPLNGQRRETIQYRTADTYGVGGTTFDSDPLVKNGVKRCKAIDLREENISSQLETLKEWYTEHLAFKENKGDARNSNHEDEYMKFYAKYYFLGFSQGTMSDNVNLPQTIGWKDSNNAGANGTFDPLAE